MCEAYLPAKLEESLQDSPSGNHPDIGAKWALNQVSELLQENCPGFHLYALNKPESTLAILEDYPENPYYRALPISQKRKIISSKYL